MLERILKSRALAFTIVAFALAALLPRYAAPDDPDGDDDDDVPMNPGPAVIAAAPQAVFGTTGRHRTSHSARTGLTRAALSSGAKPLANPLPAGLEGGCAGAEEGPEAVTRLAS